MKPGYQKKIATAIREKTCDKCGGVIPKGSDYIHETWHGEKISVISRDYHKGCDE